MAKQRVNITLTPDTVDRLRQYAEDNHLGSISAAITHLTWGAQFHDQQIDDLFDIIDRELEKDESERDLQLIANCTARIRQYDSKCEDAPSAAEIQAVASYLKKTKRE